MIGTIVFLEINISAKKIITQTIQNGLIFFDQFNVESWLDPRPSDPFGRLAKIANESSKASFAIN
jgi:hypothetical protein